MIEGDGTLQNIHPADIGSYPIPEKPNNPEQKQTDDSGEYITKIIDVNEDGLPDSILTSKPYKGNDLRIYLANGNGSYHLSLKTVNFTTDGGHILKDIRSNKGNGILVETYFPDQGINEASFLVIPQNKKWLLKETVYTTLSDQSENAFLYVCIVRQNIEITGDDWITAVKPIPAETERNKACIKKPI